MAVDCITVVLSTDTDSYLIDDYIPQWKSTLEAWRASTDLELQLIDRTGFDMPSVYKAEWRFEFDDTPETVIENIEAYLSAYAPWYVLDYHRCHHDENVDVKQCSTDILKTGGNVPSKVMENYG